MNNDPKSLTDVELKNGEKYTVFVKWDEDKAQVEITKATKIHELKKNVVVEDSENNKEFNIIKSLEKEFDKD